jgi:Fusaric acid resistance protein-like
VFTWESLTNHTSPSATMLPVSDASKSARHGGRTGTIVKVMVLTLAAVLLPIPLMALMGLEALGSFVGLAGMAAVIAVLTLGWRGGVFAAGVLGLGSTALVLVSSVWWAAAAVMALIALGFGLSARLGWQSALMWVPIALGFVASDAAEVVRERALSGVALGAAFLAWALVSSVLAMLILRRPIMPAPQRESKVAVLGYAGALTAITFATQGIAVGLDLGHTGGWLVMTPFIVMQPHLRDGWDRALRRAGGTVIGFLFVIALSFVITAPAALYVIAIIAFNLAIYAKLRGWNYLIYATFLTPAIVILEGISSSLTQTATYRLEATLGGVGLSLLAMVILGLASRRIPAGKEST